MSNFFLPLGGGNEIGASAYILSMDGTRVMIDAGMRINAPRVFPDFTPAYEFIGGLSALDALLITHAHLDHCGALTRFHYEASQVPKYATGPTIDLMQIILNDALRVSRQTKAQDWATQDESSSLLDEALASCHLISFGQTFALSRSSASVTVLHAGHILGAAGYLLEINGRRILHTGDFCLHDQRTILGADFLSQIGAVDILIIESTYAYQPESHDEPIEEQHFALAQTIARIVERGGRALIPAFAVGRAQEVAALLGDLFEQGLLDPFDVRLDGLVKAVCDIYDANRSYLQGRMMTRPGHAIYGGWVQPMSTEAYPTARRVAALPPMCIIASSGMLVDGTRSANYAKHLLPNARDAVIFSGYLDIESPGHMLMALAQGERYATINHKSVNVQADVQRFHLSAHASPKQLCSVIKTVQPKHLIFIHGASEFVLNVSMTGVLQDLERSGTHVYQAANGVPIFL